MDRENSLKVVEGLRAKYNECKDSIFSANEATTRLLLIDEVLLSLGWGKDEFNPEDYCQQAGYADYVLSIDQIPRVIVEAKKTGVTFSFPTNKTTRNEYTVSYFKSAFKSKFTEIIEQAQNYCIQKAVPYSIITNGAEWLVIPMLPKPGKTIESMKGIYFGNIFNDDFAFDLFWQLLARDSVVNSSLEGYLSELNDSPSEVCNILKAHYGELNWIKCKKEDFLDEFYENFFTQITDSTQRKMLEYCFVSDSKLDQFKGELKRVLRDSAPNFLPKNSLDLNPDESKSQILKESRSGKVVIITGSVGCGKTTLVTKCLVESRQAKSTYATPILLDLINEVTKSYIDVKETVFSYLYDQIESDYPEEFYIDELRKTFSDDIKILKNGAFADVFKSNDDLYRLKEAEKLEELKSDREKMVFKVFKKKIREGKSVIIIFDNVDRASESFQEEIYAISHKISDNSGVTVIITLREFTFFKNRDKGFLDVRPEDKVIHLKAPDFGKLISTRVKYIQNNIGEDYRIKDWGKRYNITSFLSAMYNHAEKLKINLQLSKSATAILGVLSSISWHNIRLFYGLLRRVHSQLGSSGTSWSRDDVIAALMSNLDQDEKPYIPNVFKPYQNINQCYFLKIRILSFIHDAIKRGEVSQGVTIHRVMRFCLLYGYKVDWVKRVLEECVNEKLIECLEIPSDSDFTNNYTIGRDETFRISPLGVSMILDICISPVYISLVSIDLPFHENKPFVDLKNIYEDVVSYMSNENDSQISREGIDIILQSGLSKICSEYLICEFNKEKVSLNHLRSQTEVYLTENRVSEVINFLRKSSGKADSIIRKNIPAQMPLILDGSVKLIEDDVNFDSIAMDIIPCDFKFHEFNGSEYIPLIFVALAIRSGLGFEHSSGVDITNVINQYLVDDDNRKFTNNVSRALRSKVLISQKWLFSRDDLHPKFKKFSLSKQWQDCWHEIFLTSPPELIINS
ncbi:P-loop NTPase fold protein [Serratia quinivorans]|uniref:P-loop NTPase fold protein n=1 Tax=Serratia quinivorans TaxID=137545 RepID=UPI00217A0888|nr:P-loop NTPase fold protein [Serratia quinivorans]CAI1130472.1 Predicted type IV restriction endonuclease [Serratia quinivorans]